jgi:putative selenate reductase molybdopterin-binding subunit
MPRHVPLTDEETELPDRITERNRLAAAQYLEQLQSRLSGAVETRLDVIFVEADEPSGPFGAKSVSEIAIDGVAPALASAIHDATGVWIRQLPYTPERVLAGIMSNEMRGERRNSD